MNVLVVSDTHSQLYNLAYVLNQLKDDIQAVIHLGDCFADIKNLVDEHNNIEVYGIRGNCDSLSTIPYEECLSLDGLNFFICHGHMYSVKNNLQLLRTRAKEIDADICLFGHTHVSTVFYDNDILFMNPGSISLPRDIDHRPSYGLINLHRGKILLASVFALDNSGNSNLRYQLTT